MKLKAIEMQGFKSFPEKTKMTFESGMTAIIGPNGSGKSNISDSIRWVLGEMSAKSLRGSKMEDVIFNGTAKRQPANYACVSLYLDTSEEYLTKNGIIAEPLPVDEVAPKMRLSDEEEFVITRKYYRSGESEYYINKKQVRLKDVYELFYNTGIGREGYSVIGQGKIAEVLSAKTDERRSIFEEASGISKFRYKKNEAERRLRDTDANLERINDIFTEVDSRIGPLKKEAENAEKYLVLAEEKKKLEITIWLEKIDELRDNLANTEKILASSKLELDLATDELTSLEKEEEEFTLRGYALMQHKSELDEKAALISSDIAELTKNNSVYENDAKHYAEKIESNKKEEAYAEARRAMIAEQENACRRALDEILSSAEQLKRDGKALEEKRDEIIAPGKDIEAKKTEEAQKIASAAEKLTEIVKEAASCRALISAGEKSGSGFSEELEQSKARLDELRLARDNFTEKDEESTGKVTLLKAEIAEINASLAQAESDRERYTSEVSKANIKAAAAEQQRESLLRLERLFEGYSDSVKTVMRVASEGKIKDGGRPINLHGTVASLLSTEGEYVVAIETSLGGSVQYIVSETERDAKAALRYLKTTGGGRITVLPLDTVRGRRYDTSRISSCDGFVGIASDLVSCDKKYRGIADELLGRTVIAEDLDKASAMAAKCGYSVKIVTKDGQIINAGGSYTGGSPQKKVGLFTRSADIDKLDEEITALNTLVMEAELKKRNAERRIESFKAEISEKNADLEILKAESDKIRADLSFASATYNEEEGRYNSLLEDSRRTEEEKNGLAERLASLEKEEKEVTSSRENAEKAIAGYDTALEKITKDADGIRDRLASLGMELVSLNAKAESSSDRLDELEERLKEEDEKLDEIRSEIASYEEEIKRGEDAVKENKEKLSSLEAEKEEISSEKKRIDEELIEREKTVSDRKFRLKTAQTRREQAFQSYTKLETGKQASQDEYDTVVARLWEEYELSYSAADEFRLPPEDRDKMPTRLNSVKAKIRAMGVINVKAVDEYRELKERHEFLKTQIDDLNRTRRKLDNEISRLNTTMETVFMDTFARIDSAFNRVFIELFGGGSARIELTDPENPLESGIDIILHPPGKSIKSISLLSGGEQSFAAVALYLALQEINPAPFCVLDEIEAALDEVNQAKLMDYIKAHCENTQYLIITHRRGTMERADVLYGITMREKGVSEFLKLDLATLGEKFKEYDEKQ